MFLIEERGAKYYVIPTVETVQKNFDRLDMPYDTNWEIYRLFNFTGRDFANYIIKRFNGTVIIKREFPFLSFYFKDYYDAKDFLSELEKRENLQKNTIYNNI